MASALTLIGRLQPRRRSGRQLEPDAVAAARHALDAPARADLLDQEEAHPARHVGVELLDGRRVLAARIRHRHAHDVGLRGHAQLDPVRLAGAGVEHGVGHELGRQQVQVMHRVLARRAAELGAEDLARGPGRLDAAGDLGTPTLYCVCHCHRDVTLSSRGARFVVRIVDSASSGGMILPRRRAGGYFLAEPGSAIRLCIAAFALSGMKRLPRPWALVESECDTTRSSPFMSASKPSRATSAGSSCLPEPTFVSSMSARSKNSVSVGPGISDVTVTLVSFSSLRSARANDCTNDFDAL